MSLAETIGLDVPLHGLVKGKDNEYTYYIKRFDRLTKHRKLSVEDFSQLLGESRDTKYESSMEKVISVIQQFCTYPKVELVKLFKLTLFNFLTGNEDMHLKNFSLITNNNKIMLSPVYDLLNTSIAISNPQEEIALPISDKKRGISRKLLCEYFGKERMGLNDKTIEAILAEISAKLPLWKSMIQQSQLSETMKQAYLKLLDERSKRLLFS